MLVTLGACLATSGTAMALPWSAGAHASLGRSSLAGPDADSEGSGSALGLGGFLDVLPHPRLELGGELNLRQRGFSDLTTWSLAVTAMVRGYLLLRPDYRLYAGAGTSLLQRISASISDGEDGRDDATDAIVDRDFELIGAAGVKWRGKGRTWHAEFRVEQGLSSIDSGTPSLTAKVRTFSFVIGASL